MPIETRENVPQEVAQSLRSVVQNVCNDIGVLESGSTTDKAEVHDFYVIGNKEHPEVYPPEDVSFYAKFDPINPGKTVRKVEIWTSRQAIEMIRAKHQAFARKTKG